MRSKSISVMLVPLVLLSGCMHHQPRMDKRSYHLTAQAADDSRLIDDIRVSCKKAYYDKKTDCTLVKLTVENRSNASCLFRPSDLNVPLISQDQADKLVKSPRFIKPLVATGVGVAGLFGPLVCGFIYVMSLPSGGTSGLFLLPFMVLSCVTGPAVGAITYALIPEKKNKLGLEYMCAGSKKKVIFTGETQTVLLLVKGQQIQDLSVALQTDNGRVNYALRLF